MANPYFRQVPNLDYVNRNKDSSTLSNYIRVKNLFKRAKLREDIIANLAYFTKYQIIGDDRPDNVAQEVYNDPQLDWIVLLANNILNIQNEWPLPQRTFDAYLLDKYDTYEKLNSTHHYETVEIKNSKNSIILEGGLETPSTWKTNGNFLQVSKTTIGQIFAGSGGIPSKTVTVTMNNGIKNLTVGSEIQINNVSHPDFNGRFAVTSIFAAVEDMVIKFTYDLPSIPTVLSPSLNGTEEILLTVEGNIGVGNAYYYEYFDKGLNSYVTVPSSKVVKEVTNYQYEENIENNKRNIYVIKPEYLGVIFNDMDDIMKYKKGSTQYVSETLKKGENIRLYQN